MLGILPPGGVADPQHGPLHEALLHQRGGQQGRNPQNVPQKLEPVHGGKDDGSGVQQAECFSDFLGIVWEGEQAAFL